MPRRYRWLFMVAGLLFLASNIYGASFGTFPYQIEKQSSDLELEYSIGFINPSSETVEVTLSADESEEYNVTFSQEKLRIPPGATDNPSGSGWYHLGDNSYAKIHQTTFQVDISQYREDNSLSFPIRVEAAATGNSTDSEGSQSRLVQVRNYLYRAEIDPSLRPESRPETDSSWGDNFWQEDRSTSEEDFNLEQNKSSNQEQQDDNDSNPGTTLNRSNTETSSDRTLVNKTTLILVVGIIVSLGYILMEV